MRVAHDLRNPLAAIKAAIGVVIANEPAGIAEPISRMFRNIDRAADQMNSMIANIVEETRLQAGTSALELHVTDLTETTRQVAKTAQAAARRERQDIQVIVPPDTQKAEVDGARIERALLNLLENAVRHGRSGTTIQICLEPRPGELVFSVTNEGKALSDAVRDTILAANPNTLEAPSQPIGLGLPVARAIAELHGGRLWAEPAIEEGSAITICLAIPTSDSSSPKPRIGDEEA